MTHKHGEYFSWGDIIGQNKNGTGSYSFSEANYKAGFCSSGHTLTNNIPQGNVTYDAATANMGSPWKMFTQAQGRELIDGTNSTWTTLNGVNGRTFTSKTDSTKYIFLPAGCRYNSTSREETDAFFCWLTVYCDSNNAYMQWLDGLNSFRTGHDRSKGMSIRGIK